MSKSPFDPESAFWVNAINKEVEQLHAFGVPIPPKNDDETTMEYFLRLVQLLVEQSTGPRVSRKSEALSPVGKSSEFRRRLQKIVFNAVAEGVNTLFFILLLAGVRWMVAHLFGGSRFFDHSHSLPV